MVVSVMKTTFQKFKSRIAQYGDYTQFSNDDFRKKLLENVSLENINTNSNGLKKLDQMAPGKKMYAMKIICYFSIKNYLAHATKNATKKSLSQKQNVMKIKSFILNNETFVFLYYKKLKKALCQSKSQGHS